MWRIGSKTTDLSYDFVQRMWKQHDAAQLTDLVIVKGLQKCFAHFQLAAADDPFKLEKGGLAMFGMCASQVFHQGMQARADATEYRVVDATSPTPGVAAKTAGPKFSFEPTSDLTEVRYVMEGNSILLDCTPCTMLMGDYIEDAGQFNGTMSTNITKSYCPAHYP